MRVLLVEDQSDLAGRLQRELQDQGLVVDRTERLDEASAALKLVRYALILLDRRLPDGDGISLLREVHALQPQASVLVLSAMGSADARIEGLDAGADDYLPKPFDWDELRARIRAALRRTRLAGRSVQPITCGRITYHPDTREVRVGEDVLHLRRRELLIIESLLLRCRRVVTRELLIEAVYGFGEEPSSNTLEAHVSRLRKRLSLLDAGAVIHPVRGVGYLIDDT
ncbi:response regulator transcription factor [Devosia sediminis]|uniref:Cell cycle response regulator CtrA n=1 Tax=Devosia sediminis TaxID=2798801 RepID=A0A934IZA5_9HYPH|nr:response regulator transcription factor [Devosia sediminis]MBJ3784709.1 response regulator transcription factor [Devosia sediminis]